MRITRTLLAAFLAAAGLLATQSVALAGKTPVPAPATAPALSTVTLSAADVVGGTPVVGTVTLTSAAATGGFAVALSSDDTVAATVPVGVTVPAGARTASFPVTTFPVGNLQSALIIGSAGVVTTYAIVTVHTQSGFANGSVAIINGGNGNGTITSSPAGINCRLGAVTTGTCSAFYPAGTVVKLSARAAAGSSFQGFRGTPGCGDPSRIIVARDTTVYCQPGFTLN